MEEHLIPWPHGARFTRLRIKEDGVFRDVVVHLVPPPEPGLPALLQVRHRAPADWAPLAVVVEESEDGTTWVVADSPPQTRIA